MPDAQCWRKSEFQEAASVIAISEAVEDAAGREDTKVRARQRAQSRSAHQTIIGQEAKKQMEIAASIRIL